MLIITFFYKLTTTLGKTTPLLLLYTATVFSTIHMAYRYIPFTNRRLYPDLSFFQQPTPYPRASYSAGNINSNSFAILFGFLHSSHVFAVGMEGLKKRVERSSLPSKLVDTSRSGIINVSLVTEITMQAANFLLQWFCLDADS